MATFASILMSITTILVASIAAALVAGVSYRAHALTKSGGLAAWIVGSIVFAVGGWSGSVVLITFFIAGSILSRLPDKRQQHDVELSRDWRQVAANGVIPALALLLLAARPDLREGTSLLFLGALSSMMADTTATEIGSRFGGTPISLVTFRSVERGSSGGVTVVGLVASLLGSLLVAAAYYVSGSLGQLCQLIGTHWVLAVVLGGFIGSLADSWLGATVQAKYQCGVCGAGIEMAEHCGSRSRLIRGTRWLDNNGVNLVSSLIGSIVAAALGGLLN